MLAKVYTKHAETYALRAKKEMLKAYNHVSAVYKIIGS